MTVWTSGRTAPRPACAWWCRSPLAVAVLAAIALAGCAGRPDQPAPAQEDASAGMVTVTPAPSDAVFANPGMGWQSFHRNAHEDPARAVAPSSVYYGRWFWEELEPTPGAYDFSPIDEALAEAQAAGQTLAFRVQMVTDVQGGPAWLRDLGGREFTTEHNASQGRRYRVPDLDDPLVLRRHAALIRRLGERYDGHPDIDHIDIGTVGYWGEWHYSGSRPRVPMPSVDTRKAIIDLYFEAFPTTPKLAQLGQTNPQARAVLNHALSRGAGWRADCLGDLGIFSETWNHHDDSYRPTLRAVRGDSQWKLAPVAFETCGTMNTWVDRGYDVAGILQFALDHHVTYLNNKSDIVPPGHEAVVRDFLRRIGYRYALRRMSHPAAAAPGDDLTVIMEWENEGVAPSYGDHVVALQLRDGGGDAVITATGRPVRTMLPGRHTVAQTIALPRDLPAAQYRIAVGVVDPRTGVPAVRLANAGADAGLWYPLGEVAVARQRAGP